MQEHALFRVFSEPELKRMLDPNDPSCPFNGYVGNRDAVDTLLDIIYESLKATGRLDNGELVSNRQCRARLRLQGPASAGKTTLARIFAKLLKLPFVETEASQVKNGGMIYDLLVNAYKEAELEFEPIGTRGDIQLYEAPPTIVFIDEVHLLPGKVQDQLLKATESNDNKLILSGKEIDCKEVCFIIGTTDAGRLRPAFKTRFQPIQLKKHTRAELTEIIQRSNPKLPAEVCERIADLKPVPREALRFAKTVVQAAGRRKISLLEAADLIAKREGVQAGGISQVGLAALKALADAEDGLSKKNVCSVIGIEIEEWENDILPTLLATDRHPAYVSVSGRNQITEQGRDFLNKT